MGLFERRQLSAMARAVCTFAVLVWATACASTDRVRVEAGKASPSCRLFVVVEKTAALEAAGPAADGRELIRPERIEKFEFYVQASPLEGTPLRWQIDESRNPVGLAEFELEDADTTLAVAIGSKLEQRPDTSIAVVLKSEGGWQRLVLDARHFMNTHERLLRIVGNSLSLDEN
ncbi:MAG: hypothetical protein IT454_02580 [Planctomycetes bacterium]|nr:hypothetical protein [Planctomycetota bacterium]